MYEERRSNFREDMLYFGFPFAMAGVMACGISGMLLINSAPWIIFSVLFGLSLLIGTSTYCAIKLYRAIHEVKMIGTEKPRIEVLPKQTSIQVYGDR